MGFYEVLLIFALYFIFFEHSVFPLSNEETPSLGNPLDGNTEISTERDEVTFVTESTKSLCVVEAHNADAPCPPGIKCGFQIYDEATLKPNQPFIKYCTCPEDEVCVQAGQNMVQRFFYYRCRKELESGDEPMKTTSYVAGRHISRKLSLEDKDFDKDTTLGMKAETALGTSKNPNTQEFACTTEKHPSSESGLYTVEEILTREEL